MRVEEAKQELIRFLSKKPFAPFRVFLDSGEQFDVTRRFQLGFGLSQFGYAPPGRSPTAHRRLEQIVRFEALGGATTATGTRDEDQAQSSVAPQQGRRRKRAEETIVELRRWFAKRPFAHFRIVLDNGERLEVTRQ